MAEQGDRRIECCLSIRYVRERTWRRSWASQDDGAPSAEAIGDQGNDEQATWPWKEAEIGLKGGQGCANDLSAEASHDSEDREGLGRKSLVSLQKPLLTQAIYIGKASGTSTHLAACQVKDMQGMPQKYWGPEHGREQRVGQPLMGVCRRLLQGLPAPADGHHCRWWLILKYRLFLYLLIL